uniref:Putative phosphoadenosine phosphosulfate n=1 Tax=viral metagenome TaxID=1070528 RepID=A0A6M3KX48_9ZZZZ
MQQLLIDGRTKEEEAIDFLCRHEPPDGYFLGFSGGKDSTVIDHIAIMAGVKYQRFYERTGIDPPEIVKHIKRHFPDTVFLKPKEPFFKLLVKKGFPTKTKRWCCEHIKHSLGNNIPLKHRVLGIRAEESPKRRKYGRVHNFKPSHVGYFPIFDWLEWEVWEHIDRHGLPYCSLYDEGFSRLGCVVCPFICRNDRRAVDAHKLRWPKIYRAFENAMYELYEKKMHHRHRIIGKAQLFEEFMENWYRGK